MADNIHIKFWGVRGSHPMPGAGTVGIGGNTACVEVTAGDQTIILDAGTGIIGLGRDLAKRPRPANTSLEATILFSHLHHDHTQGFPFFTPAYLPFARLHLFGPGAAEDALADLLSRNQAPAVFPVALNEMRSAKDMRSLQDGDVILLGEAVGGVTVRRPGEPLPDDVLRVRVLRSHAHPGGVFIYRIEWRGQSVVYDTDTEGYVGADQRLVAFARGADLLIHDAQYTLEHYCGQRVGAPATQGYGHSTAQMACELATAAGVKELVLFHHDPSYDDETILGIEAAAQALFSRTQAAHEGLELSVGDQAPSPTRSSYAMTGRQYSAANVAAVVGTAATGG